MREAKRGGDHQSKKRLEHERIALCDRPVWREKKNDKVSNRVSSRKEHSEVSALTFR